MYSLCILKCTILPNKQNFGKSIQMYTNLYIKLRYGHTIALDIQYYMYICINILFWETKLQCKINILNIEISQTNCLRIAILYYV